MASLKQVTSVTVTSPWSNYSAGANAYSGRGNVLNPSYPIFVFDYGGGAGIEVGYVVGTTGSAPYSSATGGINNLVQPAVYLSVIGYNYAVGGGGVCGMSGCYNNGSDECGYWSYIVNLTSNTLTTSCNEINEDGFGTHLMDAILDMQNQNMLLVFDASTASDILIWIIPFTGIQTFLSGTMPSNATWLYTTSGNSSASMYTAPVTIWNGNFIGAPYDGSTAYLWYIPLSTLYSNAVTGTPSSSSSPVTLGTLYTINTNGEIHSLTLVSTPSSSGITTYLAGFQYPSSTTAFIFTLNPSNQTIVNSTTITLPASTNGFNRASWNSIFLIATANGSTVYVTLADPKLMTSENLSTSGAYGFATSEGYLVVASSALNSSSVTFTIYQILADNTYVFQNVTISQSGTTITATGTLYNETTGSAVAGATVYLVEVNSLNDNYSNDVVVISSGTTNSNGQFTISGTGSSSVKYYGVKYVP